MGCDVIGAGSRLATLVVAGGDAAREVDGCVSPPAAADRATADVV
jgi:hypothetical protein